MSRTTRVGIVAALTAGLFVYTLSGSYMQAGELILKINFWSLISLPVIAALGIWWIRKAPR